jgi:hypothetical protein
MEYKYSYVISNLKYLQHLYNYILENSNNTLSDDFYLNIEATLDVVFNKELITEQKKILDNIILGYIPPQQLTITSKTQNIVLSQNTIMPTNTYTIIGNYFYTPPDDKSFIDYFKIISSVNGNTNYQIRVYDSLNDKILCESDIFNNTDLQILSIYNIVNLPINETLLEIHCIVSGDNKCEVKLISINFSKII